MAKEFTINIGNFTGGLNTLDSEYEVGDNEATALLNFDIIGKGSIRKRFGTTIHSTGGSNSKAIKGLLKYKNISTDDTFLCIFNDGKLYTITPTDSTWTDQGAYLGSGTKKVRGTVFAEELIFGDSIGVIQKFDGTTHGQVSVDAPSGNIFQVYNLLLFVSGEQSSQSSSRVFWCDESDVTTWTGSSPVIAGDIDVQYLNGQKVTGIKYNLDQLTIFKEKAKYALSPVLDSSGNRPLDFNEKSISDDSSGTISTDSIVSTESGIFYLSNPDDGFKKYGFAENYPDRRVPENISYKISPLVEQIERRYAESVTGVFHKNKYYCAVPIGGSVNNTVLVYNHIWNAWSVYDNMAVSDFELFEDSNGKEEIYFGSEYEGKILKFNSIFSDQYDESTGEGVAINAFYRSKTYMPSLKNRFDRILIKGKMTESSTTKIRMVVKGHGQNKWEKTEEWTITSQDIDRNVTGGSYVGGSYTGLEYFGGGGSTDGDVTMYNFLKEIGVPNTINQGREFYIEVENNNDQEGIQIDWITVSGTKLSTKVLT